jgi:UDP-GlcNAc:undecaprenyl-phosphate/decaprenyl-phosphate GlcNAc-1-phosphate transferase
MITHKNAKFNTTIATLLLFGIGILLFCNTFAGKTEIMSANRLLIPLIATIVFILVLYPIALKIGLMDRPCHRKQHCEPTPLIGGLAIYLAILLTLSLNHINLPNQSAFIAAATLLVLVGLIDDYKGLGVIIRLIAQIAATLIMTKMAHLQINDLGDLFGFGNINLGIYATAFTVFAVVGGINAFNMIDGIDGLAGSLTLISIMAIATVSWLAQHWVLLNFCIVMIAAIIAFLMFNLRIFGRTNAKIFLGDTGSTLFGFTVCWLAIYASQGENRIITPTSVLWITALPLFDSVCIMLRRISKGRSPFAPDREHLHHILSLAGYSVNQILIILLVCSLIVSITGIAASFFLNVPQSVLFMSFLLLFTCHYWCMSHAWKMVKIARYLQTKKAGDEKTKARRNKERRCMQYNLDINERRIVEERRNNEERRYIPTAEQLEKIAQTRYKEKQRSSEY